MKKGNKKGFTLIELIVVLAILAIIAAIAIPSAFGSIDNARQQADEATVASINSAIRMYASLHMKDGAPPNGTGDTVTKALTDAGVDVAKIKLQSEKSGANWIPPSINVPVGHYEYKNDGTATNPIVLTGIIGYKAP